MHIFMAKLSKFKINNKWNTLKKTGPNFIKMYS